MDEKLAQSVGGIAHCLKAPAYKVEEFCEGVLFQLTKEPFDAASKAHKKAQMKEMKHLGLA